MSYLILLDSNVMYSANWGSFECKETGMNVEGPGHTMTDGHLPTARTAGRGTGQSGKSSNYILVQLLNKELSFQVTKCTAVGCGDMSVNKTD